MGDNQYQEEKETKGKFKLMLVLWIVTVVITACIATGVMVFMKHDDITKIISDSTETVYTDTVTTDKSVYTVQDILDFRENLKEGIRIDSIFLTLPEPILVEILTNMGTSLSNKDIVYTYEGNKEYYNNILKGANIQKDILAPRDTLINKTIP